MAKHEASPPNLFAVLAITVGAVALGLYALDLHTHTCEGCGHSWRHLGAFNVGDPGAHTCDRCECVQWWKDGVPHVFRSALQQPPPKAMLDTRVERLQEIHEAPRMTLAAGTGLAWPFGGGSK